MEEYVEWGDIVGKSSGSQTGIGRLFLKGGNKYIVRPLHKPVRFFKYFLYDKNKKLRTAIVIDPDTDPVGKKHPDLKRASSRYGMYVIDRSDQKLKVMEFPAIVFTELNDRFILNSKPPGGIKDGGDWQIVVEGQGINTKYRCQYIEDTPIKEEEMNKIKELLKETKVKLPDLFKAHTPEEIEERLFGDWEKVYGKKDSEDSDKISGPEGEIDPETLW